MSFLNLFISPSSSSAKKNKKIFKLTDPRVLVKLSACIREVEKLFERFDADADGRIFREEFEDVYRATFTDGDAPGRLDELWKYLSRGSSGSEAWEEKRGGSGDGRDADEEKERRRRQKGFVDKKTWMSRVRLRDVPSIVPRCRTLGPLAAASPTAEELGRLDNLMGRLRGLAAAAKEKNVRIGERSIFVFASSLCFSSSFFFFLNLFRVLFLPFFLPSFLQKQVRLLIDAEYSTVQPAIDAAALELMREFNTTGGEEEGPGGNDDREGSSGSGRTLSSSPPSFAVPTVYNTTQCYLRGAEEKLRGELELAAAEGFSWGGKLVRGAYLESENRRAAAAGRASPCWPSVEGTHECYDACARIAVEEGVFAGRGEVLLATVRKGKREREREEFERGSLVGKEKRKEGKEKRKEGREKRKEGKEKRKEGKEKRKERPTRKKNRKSQKIKNLSQHNKSSVSKAVDLLSRLEKEQPAGDAPSSRVSFGQLYGMR